jgi:hypothetical protein
MCVAGSIINTVPGGIEFVCPPNEDDDEGSASCDAWAVPGDVGTVLPLLYWIVFNSVVAYLLMTWGNQYAEPSSVLGYTALQPLTSSLLTVMLIGIGAPKDNLDMPGYNLLGGVLIVAGLYMLLADNKVQAAKAADAETSAAIAAAQQHLLLDDRA